MSHATSLRLVPSVTASMLILAGFVIPAPAAAEDSPVVCWTFSGEHTDPARTDLSARCGEECPSRVWARADAVGAIGATISVRVLCGMSWPAGCTAAIQAPVGQEIIGRAECGDAGTWSIDAPNWLCLVTLEGVIVDYTATCGTYAHCEEDAAVASARVCAGGTSTSDATTTGADAEIEQGTVGIDAGAGQTDENDGDSATTEHEGRLFFHVLQFNEGAEVWHEETTSNEGELLGSSYGGCGEAASAGEMCTEWTRAEDDCAASSPIVEVTGPCPGGVGTKVGADFRQAGANLPATLPATLDLVSHDGSGTPLGTAIVRALEKGSLSISFALDPPLHGYRSFDLEVVDNGGTCAIEASIADPNDTSYGEPIATSPAGACVTDGAHFSYRAAPATSYQDELALDPNDTSLDPSPTTATDKTLWFNTFDLGPFEGDTSISIDLTDMLMVAREDDG